MFYPDRLSRDGVIPAGCDDFLLNLLTVSIGNEVLLMLLEKADMVNSRKETNKKMRKQAHLFIT